MKKAIWVKVGAIAVAAIPPIAVLLANYSVFVERTDKAISAAALLVAVICACIFKDATKKFFEAPSAFKICLVCFLFSYIAVTLGEQMLEISATALISGACGIPLNMWYNSLTKPATTDDIVDALQGLVKESNGDEKSDKKS